MLIDILSRQSRSFKTIHCLVFEIILIKDRIFLMHYIYETIKKLVFKFLILEKIIPKFSKTDM